MLESLQTADEMMSAALDVLEKNDDRLLSALDRVPAPLYVTDACGFVTYFNPPCIDFAGRTPAVGKDRWCVTWKLFTDTGEFLPRDQCAMADAIHCRREVRDVSAVAERPDGTRVNFMPYSAPILSEDDELLGAVNILIDITEQCQASEFRAQAVRCRRLAAGIGDERARNTLELMAKEYDEKANAPGRGKPVR
jgi:PAS domain-containing protein